MSNDVPGPKGIREPWLGLLRGVDAALHGPVELHAVGGFALGVLAGWPRPTGDIDLIGILPSEAAAEILSLAGPDSALASKLHVHVEVVTVADPPCDYADRLIDVTPSDMGNLMIKLLEPHDLALTKLDRNSPRDRDDVRFLAERGLVRRDTLVERYENELRPYVRNERRLDSYFDLWIEELFGD